MFSIGKIAKREIEYVLKTRSRRILLFVIPLVVYFFIPAIYSKQAVTDVPVAILDEDNTELSRAITRFVDASATMNVVFRAASFSEIKDMILKDEIKAAFYFPHGMTAKIKKGGSATAEVLINTQNIVYGNLIYKSASEILVTVSTAVSVKKLGAEGLPVIAGMNLAMPFRIIKRPLFNPNYDYMQYLAPGILTVLFQMIIMFAATSSVNREFSDKRNIEKLLKLSEGNYLNIFLGKALSYVVFSIFPAALILFVVFPVMGIAVYGNTALLFLYFMFFAFVSASLGLMISSIFIDNVLALDVAFFYNSPAFVFSGFTFPIWALPAYDRFYAQLIPYTHFIDGFLQLYQMDTPVKYALPSLLSLTVFAVVGFSVGIFAFRFQLKKQSINFSVGGK